MGKYGYHHGMLAIATQNSYGETRVSLLPNTEAVRNTLKNNKNFENQPGFGVPYSNGVDCEQEGTKQAILGLLAFQERQQLLEKHSAKELPESIKHLAVDVTGSMSSHFGDEAKEVKAYEENIGKYDTNNDLLAVTTLNKNGEARILIVPNSDKIRQELKEGSFDFQVGKF